MPSPKPDMPTPLCECGCGGPTSWNPSRNHWGRFIHGHNMRGKPSPNRKDYGQPPPCACGCGQLVTSKRYGRWCNFIHGHQFRGQKHSRESRQKMHQAKHAIADQIAERVSGENNPMWRNGHAQRYHDERKAAGWNWWQARKMHKRLIAERGNQCERCGATNAKLELHHIDHDLFNNDPENFQLVCRNCQMKATAEFVKQEQVS